MLFWSVCFRAKEAFKLLASAAEAARPGSGVLGTRTRPTLCSNEPVQQRLMSARQSTVTGLSIRAGDGPFVYEAARFISTHSGASRIMCAGAPYEDSGGGVCQSLTVE